MTDISATPNNDSSHYRRTLLRQTLQLQSSGNNWVLLNLQVNGENLLKFEFVSPYGNPGALVSQMESVETSELSMLKIALEPAKILEYFPDLDQDRVPVPNSSELKNLGFWRFGPDGNLTNALEPNHSRVVTDSEVDQLSLGNQLCSLLENPEFVLKSSSEVGLIENFFKRKNIAVGMFGNFKFALKAITAIVLSGKHELTESLLREVIECLGGAYGQLEGYLSKGTMPPVGFAFRYSMAQADSEPELFLQTVAEAMPEFGGKMYPSFPTAQYLSRKGLRLYQVLQENPDELLKTIFKLSVLSASDAFDQRSETESEYQILTNALVFDASADSKRDRSGRKSLLSADPEYKKAVNRHIENSNEEALELISQWVKTVEGKNKHIDIYRAITAMELGIDVTWNKYAVSHLSDSSNAKIRKSVAAQIAKSPNFFAQIDSRNWPMYLRMISLDSVEAVLMEFSNYPWEHGGLRSDLVSKWIASIGELDLTEKEINISQKILAKRWGRWGQIGTGDDYYNYLFKVARQTQLTPGAEWTAVTDFSTYGTTLNSYFDFLGLNAAPGLLSTLKEVPREVLNSASVTIVEYLKSLQWASEEEKQSTKAALNLLDDDRSKTVIALLAKGLLGGAALNSYYPYSGNLAEQIDPYIVEYVPVASRRALVERLLVESLEFLYNEETPSTDGMYQLNRHGDLFRFIIGIISGEFGLEITVKYAQEIEKSLVSWVGFPEYLWNNLNQIEEGALNFLASLKSIRLFLVVNTTPTFVSQADNRQTALLEKLLADVAGSEISNPFLVALLLAPNSGLNELGVSFANADDRVSSLWLQMLESDLPATSKAGLEYLESQAASEEFIEMVMQALDSSNKFARSSAIALLEKNNSPKLLVNVVSKLTENRNPDTWGLVSGNLELVSEARDLRKFTKRVFLTRRQARSQKEQLKLKISALVRELGEVIEKDLILRLSVGAINKDREWALRQLAESEVSIPGVTVETTWKAGKSV